MKMRLKHIVIIPVAFAVGMTVIWIVCYDCQRRPVADVSLTTRITTRAVQFKYFNIHENIVIQVYKVTEPAPEVTTTLPAHLLHLRRTVTSSLSEHNVTSSSSGSHSVTSESTTKPQDKELSQISPNQEKPTYFFNLSGDSVQRHHELLQDPEKAQESPLFVNKPNLPINQTINQEPVNQPAPFNQTGDQLNVQVDDTNITDKNLNRTLVNRVNSTN